MQIIDSCDIIASEKYHTINEGVYMPRYKLMFQNASWQHRKFISLTKIEDDGSSRVLNCVMGEQISFGTYASGFLERGAEYKHEQTCLTNDMMGSPIADEVFFTQLLGENILERIFRDKDFLNQFEAHERRGNHPVLIEAALDLQKGKCRETIGRIDSTYYPKDYRAYVVRHYINYLLNRDGMRINVHPEGIFTEIHVSDRCAYSVRNGGVNDLPVTIEDAVEIRKKMEALIVDEYPPYPVIHQQLFLGVPVPYKSPGCYLEMTDPTAEQKQIIDSLFNLASEKGFFPDNPKEIIRRAWESNCRKMSDQVAASFYGAGSPALLSPTVRVPTQDDPALIDTDEHRFDIRFRVGQQ